MDKSKVKGKVTLPDVSLSKGIPTERPAPGKPLNWNGGTVYHSALKKAWRCIVTRGQKVDVVSYWGPSEVSKEIALRECLKAISAARSSG